MKCRFFKKNELNLKLVKKIVTHINPDLDAVASVWLIKRFLPGWQEAEIEFAQTTTSIEGQKDVDQNPNILWVDVGRGKLDHHQTGKYLSAAKLCFDYLKKKRRGQNLSPLEEKALEELVEIVTQVDNARDLNWPEIGQNRYYFYLHILIEGLRGLGETDQEIMEFGMRTLDSVLLNLKNKIRAKEELEQGIRFETSWGEAIAVETGNKHVLWQGEVQGYVLVVKKDPESGGVQIYSRPDSEVDLTAVYNQVKELDPNSDWFLHASKKLLLNQASVNPEMRPTKLSLERILEVLKLAKSDKK